MLHPEASLALSELNVKYFFTDAREFKKSGNVEMFNLAVAHIKRLRREIHSAKRQIRWQKELGDRPITLDDCPE